jgi:hypothetical protein
LYLCMVMYETDAPAACSNMLLNGEILPLNFSNRAPWFQYPNQGRRA